VIATARLIEISAALTEAGLDFLIEGRRWREWV
jgi:hypothetical protein